MERKYAKAEVYGVVMADDYRSYALCKLDDGQRIVLKPCENGDFMINRHIPSSPAVYLAGYEERAAEWPDEIKALGLPTSAAIPEGMQMLDKEEARKFLCLNTEICPGGPTLSDAIENLVDSYDLDEDDAKKLQAYRLEKLLEDAQGTMSDLTDESISDAMDNMSATISEWLPEDEPEESRDDAPRQ